MKKGKVLGFLALSAILLTGCVDSMPELTAEQSDMITEYAASLLLKYSSRYNYKIVSEEEVAAAKAAEQELSEPAVQEESGTEVPSDGEASAEAPNQPEASGQEETETEEPETKVTVSAEDIDFAAELGIDDLILRYQSFEVCASYPQNNSGFSVDAAQGKKLLVVHFDLEGSAEEDVDCNMFDYNIRLRLNINDTGSVTALSTMLPDELMTYIDVVPAGRTVDVVAVAEVNDIAEDEVEALTIQMSSNGGNCTAKIR